MLKKSRAYYTIQGQLARTLDPDRSISTATPPRRRNIRDLSPADLSRATPVCSLYAGSKETRSAMETDARSNFLCHKRNVRSQYTCLINSSKEFSSCFNGTSIDCMGYWTFKVLLTLFRKFFSRVFLAVSHFIFFSLWKFQDFDKYSN